MARTQPRACAPDSPHTPRAAAAVQPDEDDFRPYSLVAGCAYAWRMTTTETLDGNEAAASVAYRLSEVIAIKQAEHVGSESGAQRSPSAP